MIKAGRRNKREEWGKGYSRGGIIRIRDNKVVVRVDDGEEEVVKYPL